jgi:hypothetical protein
MHQVQAVVKLLHPLRWPLAGNQRMTGMVPVVPGRLKKDDVELLRTGLRTVEPALVEARKMDQFPRGRIGLVWSRRGIGDTRFPQHQLVRLVPVVLWWDVVLQTEDGNIDGALRACRGIFHCGRVIGDDPAILVQLMRIAIAKYGVTALERALLGGEADEPLLVALQTVLAEESDHPRLRVAARGERGSTHWFMSAVGAGDIPLAELARILDPEGKKGDNPLPGGQDFRPVHAQVLRQMTRWVEITSMPLSEQPSRVRQWAKEQHKPGRELLLGMAGSAEKLTEATVSLQAQLGSAVAALAAERYRRAQGRWPPSLEALVPVYLAKVPGDPYDDKPLRYRQAGDGVVVYSIGPDRTDNQGKLDRTGRPPAGTDVGFQLWDVAKRGRTPR